MPCSESWLGVVNERRIVRLSNIHAYDDCTAFDAYERGFAQCTCSLWKPPLQILEQRIRFFPFEDFLPSTMELATAIQEPRIDAPQQLLRFRIEPYAPPSCHLTPSVAR